MKSIVNFKIFAAILMFVFAFGAIETLAQKRKPTIRRATVRKAVKPAVPYYRVDSGTVFRVRLNETLSSKTARIGDRFTVTVTEPVYSDSGRVVIPVGSRLTGRVDSVTAAKKGGNPGQIGVSFVAVRLPNGATRAINASLTDLHSDDAKSDNESTASGDRMKNRKLIFIGGGAGGGALIGAIAGGAKGAAIGGILGGLGGFIGERMTKGEDAEVRAGTEFGVQLNQAISLPRYVEPR